MKRLFTITAAVLITLSIWAQSPQKMSYQAVIRNSSDQLVKTSPVGMCVSILLGSETGTEVYKEIYSPNPQTNSNGLVKIEIGGGIPLTGTFSAINWSAGTYFIKTETDPTGGTTYTITGTSQLLSVPYALYAKTTETSADAVKITGNQTIAGDKTFSNKIIVSQQGIGTATPNASSALEISSTTQGFLPPRMTQAQRDAITIVNGLMVYNTDTKKPNYCNGFEWRNFDGTPTITIGDSYQGGKIAYILQSDDPGYDANVTHGLIVAPSDQSTGAQWGCYGTVISGADGSAIGTGNQNTIDIVTACTTAGIAAQLCYDLTLNGYSDWYLPSKDELNKLYINRVALGGFPNGGWWSSTEWDNIDAYAQNLLNGIWINYNKTNTLYVRAVRAF